MAQSPSVLLLSGLYIICRYRLVFHRVNYLSATHWQRQTQALLWISMATTRPGATFAVASEAGCACHRSRVHTCPLAFRNIHHVFDCRDTNRETKQENSVLSCVLVSLFKLPVQTVSLETVVSVSADQH